MALPVREPTSPLARLHDDIARMFEGFTLPEFFSHHRGGRWSPAMDM